MSKSHLVYLIANYHSACVSAAFRLATTVSYGEAADSVYALGPLVFWATAEMTCGFFVCCMPCTPKILQETGVIRNMKRAFNMKSTTKGTSNSKVDQYSSNISHAKSVASTTNAYYKLDEDGIPMGAIKSESTEQLHNDKLHTGITRTTQITITQDDRSMSDTGSNISPLPVTSRSGWPGQYRQ